MHHLLTVLTESVLQYLQAQIASGADVVMLFDTWGGLLSSEDYMTFSLVYLQMIVAGLKENQATAHVPVILFTKGGGQWLEAMAETGCDALGIDWNCDLTDAKHRVGHRVALQGDLNPAVLREADEVINAEANKLLSVYGHEPGYIFNLGHGITPDIHPEKVQLLVEVVQSYE